MSHPRRQGGQNRSKDGPPWPRTTVTKAPADPSFALGFAYSRRGLELGGGHRKLSKNHQVQNGLARGFGCRRHGLDLGGGRR